MSEHLSEFNFSYGSSSLRVVFSHKDSNPTQDGLGEKILKIDEVLTEMQTAQPESAMNGRLEDSSVVSSGGTVAVEQLLGDIDEVLKDNVPEERFSNEV